MPPRPYQEIEALVARQHWQEAVVFGAPPWQRSAGRGTVCTGAQDRDARAPQGLQAFGASDGSRHARIGGAFTLADTTSNITGKTLLVISRNTHVAPATLRLGRLLALAAPVRSAALHWSSLVSSRCFDAAFRRWRFGEAGLKDSEAYEQANVVASYETLTKLVGIKDNGIIAALPVLRPDAGQQTAFRNKYRSTNPLVGICWHSTNEEKGVPRLRRNGPLFLGRNSRRPMFQFNTAMHGPMLSGYDNRAGKKSFTTRPSILFKILILCGTGGGPRCRSHDQQYRHTHGGSAGRPNVCICLTTRTIYFGRWSGHTTGLVSGSDLYRKANRHWLDVFADLGTDSRTPIIVRTVTSVISDSGAFSEWFRATIRKAMLVRTK